MRYCERTGERNRRGAWRQSFEIACSIPSVAGKDRHAVSWPLGPSFVQRIFEGIWRCMAGLTYNDISDGPAAFTFCGRRFQEEPPVRLRSFETEWGMLTRRMLQRTLRNPIGRRSTRVCMTCRAFSLWLERQSSSLLSFVRFSYQFSSVVCLFVQCIKVK
jgi:hypothetical protein